VTIALASLCTATTAQGAGAPSRAPLKRVTRSFTSGDGSRFILIQDPQLRQLHWALASWADGRDDPPSLPGLAIATARASLRGTWSTGSKDAEAEKAALTALDHAWHQQTSDQANASNQATLEERARVAAALCDQHAFERVLAAAPAHRPEILERDGVAVFALTTIEPALLQVARLVYERREEQALRGMTRTWLPALEERVEQSGRHPERRIHAELLTLTTPTSPSIALLEPPPLVTPKRSQALATWAASQHPTRTVHLLYGSFNLDRAEATLQSVFERTDLPPPQPRGERAAQPLSAQRRSVVPGADADSVSLAWVLPPGADPWTVQVATRWLTNPQNGRLLQTMIGKRPKLELNGTGPWPTLSTPNLLRIDARDSGDPAGLAQELIDACSQAAAEEFQEGYYYRANVSALADWFATTTDGRALAVMLAERALASPDAIITPEPPQRVPGSALRSLLRATFAGQPAIVEGDQ